MNILFIGDVVGAPGRRAIEELLSKLVDHHFIDLVVANGENAAGGLSDQEWQTTCFPQQFYSL